VPPKVLCAGIKITQLILANPLILNYPAHSFHLMAASAAQLCVILKNKYEHNSMD
jgi:hypothetical protein